MTNGNIKTVYRTQVTKIQLIGSKQLGIRETILQAFLIKINSLIGIKTPLKGRSAVSFDFSCRVSPSSILF
jgi:hypothetical protein